MLPAGLRCDISHVQFFGSIMKSFPFSPRDHAKEKDKVLIDKALENNTGSYEKKTLLVHFELIM